MYFASMHKKSQSGDEELVKNYSPVWLYSIKRVTAEFTNYEIEKHKRPDRNDDFSQHFSQCLDLCAKLFFPLGKNFSCFFNHRFSHSCCEKTTCKSSTQTQFINLLA